MTRVRILQHMDCEPAGTVGDVLSSSGITTVVTRADLGDAIPSSLDDADGLVIMGGPMGVYEQDRYPFLTEEMQLIREAAARDIPVLGICLGGQLVSAAMGGEVKKGQEREIGWHALHLTDEGLSDPLFGALTPYFNAGPRDIRGFVWHGDYFSLPPNGVLLAYSDMAPCQAIRCGHGVYGLQLHPEVSKETVAEWVEAWPGQLTEAGVDPSELLEDTTRYIATLHSIAVTLTERWIELVLERASRESLVA